MFVGRQATRTQAVSWGTGGGFLGSMQVNEQKKRPGADRKISRQNWHGEEPCTKPKSRQPYVSTKRSGCQYTTRSVPPQHWGRKTWGRYHGGRRPSSDDSLHSPTVIPPSPLDKPSIMKRYHRRWTTRWGVTARSPTIVTLPDTRFVEWRWWNDGWTVKTVVTWRSSASMIPAPREFGLSWCPKSQTGKVYLRVDLLEQFDMLPHSNRSCRSHLLSHPASV